MRPHYSHSSRENAIPSNGTSLLASCKGVPPRGSPLLRESFLPVLLFNPSPQRPKLPNSESIWNARIHFNGCSLVKKKLQQITFFQAFRLNFVIIKSLISNAKFRGTGNEDHAQILVISVKSRMSYFIFALHLIANITMKREGFIKNKITKFV